jgi:hypothetical protein
VTAPVDARAMRRRGMRAVQAASTPGQKISNGAQLISRDEIQKWFQQSWPKLTVYPEVNDCYKIALWLDILNIKHSPGRSKSVIRPKAAEHGKLFLKHLPDARRKLEIYREQFEQNQVLDPWREGQYKELTKSLDAIDEAERAVRIAVDAMTCAPVQGRDPVEWIAEATIDVWDKVNHWQKLRGIPPLDISFGRQPDSPLSKFVQLALAAIGLHLARNTISDHLRGRNKRPRTSAEGAKTFKQRPPGRKN